tara:strand:+ start:583 stop:831 length:249 start_codon:yes stop_codon:yes gene_type:complete
MVDVTMSMDEYLSLLGGLTNAPSDMSSPATAEMPKKKRSSAYSRRYKANFKKIAPRFKMKSGRWKKNGFKSAVKLAHKMSKK